MTPSLRRRMACWLYEGILQFAVFFVAGYLFSALTQSRNAMTNRTSMQIFLLLVSGIYFVWFWSKGQTLAMKTWNIRLVDLNDKPVSQARSLLRYALCWIWFIPALMAVAPFKLSGGEMAVITLGWIVFYALTSRLHPQQQFWHDAWSGTKLISSRHIQPTKSPPSLSS